MDAERRRLLVVRHAKSAWPPGVPDLRRPLGPRGQADELHVLVVRGAGEAVGSRIEEVEGHGHRPRAHGVDFRPFVARAVSRKSL